MRKYGHRPAVIRPVVAFYDHDINRGGKAWDETAKPGERWRTAMVNHKLVRGAKLIMYPHTAGPEIWWDGIYPPFPHADAKLVFAEGQRVVLEIAKYPAPVHVIGWPYVINNKPFTPQELRHILFMPIHPTGGGGLRPIAQELNQATFEKLLEMKSRKNFVLTVRYIHKLEQQGLWQEPGVQYVKAMPDGSTLEMRAANLVVAEGTALSLAVALKKPALQLTTVNGMNNQFELARPLVHLDQYEDFIRYPLCVRPEDMPDRLDELAEKAVRTDAGAEWRRMFIGERFEPGAFHILIKKIMAQ